MFKFLSKPQQLLINLKSGISKHSAKWAGQAETPASIQNTITEINSINSEIIQLQAQLTKKLHEAKQLGQQSMLLCDSIIKKAKGFHSFEPVALVDYGIKARKTKEKRPVPATRLGVSIVDDVDKEGFIVSTSVDPLAEQYQWERGVAEDAKDVNTIAPMTMYKSTSRSSFTDNDILPGLRYFYRVRALNRNGEGPWSSAASKVQ